MNSEIIIRPVEAKDFEEIYKIFSNEKKIVYSFKNYYLKNILFENYIFKFYFYI